MKKIKMINSNLYKILITQNKNIINYSNYKFSSNPYIFSIDQGTTSTRLALIDDSLNIKGKDQMEHKQIHQNTSWTEHSPMELKGNINNLIKNLHDNHSKVIFLIFDIVNIFICILIFHFNIKGIQKY